MCALPTDTQLVRAFHFVLADIYLHFANTQELGRAVHMAFFTWTPGAIITKDCDEDIQNYCLAARPNMASRPGAVGSCLANIVSCRLSPVVLFSLPDVCHVECSEQQQLRAVVASWPGAVLLIVKVLECMFE